MHAAHPTSLQLTPPVWRPCTECWARGLMARKHTAHTYMHTLCPTCPQGPHWPGARACNAGLKTLSSTGTRTLNPQAHKFLTGLAPVHAVLSAGEAVTATLMAAPSSSLGRHLARGAAAAAAGASRGAVPVVSGLRAWSNSSAAAQVCVCACV